MDARLITPEVADILARLKWMRHIRFSCDQESQIEPILRACELLKERGVKPYRVFVYLLVTSDLDNASRRVEALKGLRGINLYAQAERNESLGIRPGKAQLEFAQRYVYAIYRQGTSRTRRLTAPSSTPSMSLVTRYSNPLIM